MKDNEVSAKDSDSSDKDFAPTVGDFKGETARSRVKKAKNASAYMSEELLSSNR